MNIDEIIAQLRDVHTPEFGQEIAIQTFNWWPVGIYLILLALWFWRLRNNANHWRRESEVQIKQIEHLLDQHKVATAWQSLAQLLRRIAIKVRAQDNDDIRVASLTGQPWLDELDALFTTDIFSQGPGAGVNHYPYIDDSKDTRAELRTVLQVVSQRLSQKGLIE